MDKLLSFLTLWIIRFVFVEEGTNLIITRFGKYSKTLKPGLCSFFSLWGLFGKIHTFKLTDPITSKITKTHKVDMKEIVFDYPKERVISKDNVQFEVNAIIYFNVFDPYRAIFRVTDFTSSLRSLVQSILRAEIGNHNLEQTYSNRALISQALTKEADKATDEWGIRVLRLEIKEFELGKFAEQLLRQKQQDIEKRQQILQAEGEKEAKIREAEGIRESKINVAEGEKIAAAAQAEAIKMKAGADAEAIKVKYQAEAEGYNLIANVLKEHPTLINFLKLNTADKVSKNLGEGNASKVYLPTDLDKLVSLLSAGKELVRT